MATRKPKSASAKIEPSTVVGSHLTVMTDNFGKTTLIWDDEALLRDVRAALLKAESTLPVAEEKPKRTRKKKEA